MSKNTPFSNEYSYASSTDTNTKAEKYSTSEDDVKDQILNGIEGDTNFELSKPIRVIIKARIFGK